MRAGRNPAGKQCLALLLAAICLFCSAPFAKAEETAGFSFSLSETEGSGEDAVNVSLAYGGGQGELGAFLVRVEYDPEYLMFQSAVEGESVHGGYSLTQSKEGVVDSGYVKKGGEEGILSSDELFRYRFRVREDAPEGETELSISVYQILTPDFSELEPVEQSLLFTVLPPPSSDASLISLQPETGELNPAFSPDCFTYTMTVPFSVTSLNFFAEPAEGAVCKINRKNLGADGSDTVFLLTVTAEDGKTKSVYQVTVHREERAVNTMQGSENQSGAGASSGKQTGSTAEVSSAPVSEQESVEAASQTVLTVPAAAHTEVYPSVTVTNGRSSRFPMVFSLLVMVLTVVVSGPLSRWICAVIPEKPKQKEDPEQEDTDKIE